MSVYDLLATLSGAKIDYVLIGGLAVTLYGDQVAEPRIRRLFENASSSESNTW